MITSDELAFVRLAMRKRILSVNTVQEAVERKRWDAPNRPIAEILIDMGALEPEAVAKLRRLLEEPASPARDSPAARDAVRSSARARQTQPGRDPNAREAPQERTERGGPPSERGREKGPGRGIPERIGPYRLMRLLGAGAMGAVYHARHGELERDVALKLLQSEGAPTQRAIARFKREARLAARLDHPNIVRVYEAGLEDGQHFIAMDMVRGRSVAELITLGEVPARRAVHIMRRVAEAVGYAHEQGVIHRDLKPANILVDEKSGDPRVTDFGLAVLAEPDEDDKLTRTGAAVGTPAYMAPEQVRGKLDEIDARTDVYALGATLYEMLTGSPPFDAPTFLELAKRICEQDPVAPRRRNPQVPADVETVCLKALEKDKTQRYATAFDMAKDLAAFIDDAPIVAQRPSPVELARRWARRRPGIVAAAAGFIVVLLIGLGVWLSTPGTLEVTTVPAGAVVRVDGVQQKDEQGNLLLTPADGYLRLRVRAGEHDLSFEKDGYLERALFVERVQVGHGDTRTLTGTLVSRSGLLRVTTAPPGAPIQVFRDDGQRVVGERLTPLFESLPAGRYRIVIGAMAGYAAPPELVEVVPSGGGVAEPPAVMLKADLAQARVESDPEGATQEDDPSRFAPITLPGAGKHELVLVKPGYLPARVAVDVPPGARIDRRASLRPLASARRLLEGRLLGAPLASDVDGDGHRDLVVLEDVLDGVRLTLFPGGGHAQARFRVPTASTVTTLIGLEDTDGDGVLDVLLGGPTHLEVRDGRTGRQLAQVTGWDARGAALHRPRRGAAQLVLLEDGERPRALPATLAGVAPRPPAAPVARTAGGPPPPACPVVMECDLRSLTPQLVAVFPVDGGLLVWALEGNAAPKRVTLAGVTRGSQVMSVVVERTADPWVVVLPPAGAAHLVDPRAPSRHHALGEPTSRLTRPASLLADRPWLILTDGDRSRLFQLSPDSPREVAPDPVPGPGAVVLREPGEPGAAPGPPPALWTLAGEVLVLGPGGGWSRLREASTDPGPWVQRDGEPVVADVDGDGAPEVLLPGPDRRAIVSLDPLGQGARWRVRSPRPDAAAVVHLAGPSDLALGIGERLVALAGEDGRPLGELALPGRCLAVAPGAEPGVVYVASAPREASAGGGAVQRLRWRAGAWQESEGWTQQRPARGVASLPLDVDGEAGLDVAVSGPLAVLRAGDGRELWAERLGGRADAMGTAGPCVAPGNPPLVLGVKDPGRAGEPALLVAHDPASATAVWEQALPEGEPRALLADEGLTVVVVVLGRRVLGVGRTDGLVRWSADLGDVVGAALTRERSVVVVTRAAGDAVALDASAGTPVWARDLPAGRPGAIPSAPVRLAKSTVEGAADEESVAIVAPSGALLLLAAKDGAVLGERRAIDGAYAPWLLRWPASAREEGLVLATDDGRLTARAAGPRRRGVLQRRERMREQVRRLDEAEVLARLARSVTVTPGVVAGGDTTSPAVQALAELEALVTEDPTDANAQLALARGALAAGELEKAQQAARAAQRARPRLPEALRVMVEATFAQRNTLESVDGLLDDLAQVDPAQAAGVAVTLARKSGGDPSRFLRRCRDLAPLDPGVRRLLGLVRLERIGRRVWSAVGPDELLDARRAVAEARVELILSLVREDVPEARSAALVALVLEKRITAVFYARRQTRPDHERAALVGGLLSGLAAPTGPTPPGDDGLLLERARALGTLGDQDDAAPLCDELRRLRPAWEDALQGIAALRP